MLLDRAVLVNLFSRSNSQKQARKSGGHVVGEFNRTDPSLPKLSLITLTRNPQTLQNLSVENSSARCCCARYLHALPLAPRSERVNCNQGVRAAECFFMYNNIIYKLIN